MVVRPHRADAIASLDTQSLLRKAAWTLILPLALSWPGGAGAQQNTDDIPDVSGEYHFLSPEDTLGLLEEDGKLKGYVDAYQNEEESDEVLSYPITIGSRKNGRVEFKTGRIHEKYFRFSGTVQRGSGRGERDPDYLHLVGDLEIVTSDPDSGQEAVERRHVVFKSLGEKEKQEE